jgi:uncharacterized protein
MEARTMADYKLIDGWVNMPAEHKVGYSPAVARWFKSDQTQRMKGATLEDLISDMDAAGVEKALVCARMGWMYPTTRPVGPLATSHGTDDELFDQWCVELAEAVAKYPGRLYGTTVIDPMGGMMAVRQAERAIRDYKFVALRIFASVAGIPVNDPLYYPIYTKAIEMGVPVTVNIGVPGPRRPARLQQPMLLEDILLAYPEITIVATHIGHPWHLETVALLQKHPNFFLMTSGWAPKYIPEEIVHFLNSRGSTQVMWASDFPLIPIERAAREGAELPLKDEVRRRYLRDNCLEVFKLK